PLEIPAWIFGLAFILISILGIKAQEDNIGHEAHLGGAITGVIVYSLFEPQVAWANWGIVVAILVPTVLFLYWIYRFPEVLLVRSYWGPNLFNRVTEEAKEYSPEEELNTLLDKIKAQGMQSLSKKERSRLQQLSEKQR
ncbi:MAG: rhomboid family intramembrane serine protease, partial [Bacteroidota bacterium]